MAESEGHARLPGTGGYPVPAAGTHRSEETVGKSRFVASIGRAGSRDEARAFIEAVRAELPTATHHCWAYNTGPPGDDAHVGLSDAGEPRGTAGRPILDVLSNSGVGEIVAVVTRYFGGVKLGRGGLARAYAAAVQRALADIETVPCVPSASVSIRIPFAAADPVFRLLERIGAERDGESYASDLTIEARVPRAGLARVLSGVAEITSGAGDVRVLDDPR